MNAQWSRPSRGFVPVILVGIIKKGANSTIRLTRSLPLCRITFFPSYLSLDNVSLKQLALIATSNVLQPYLDQCLTREYHRGMSCRN